MISPSPSPSTAVESCPAYPSHLTLYRCRMISICHKSEAQCDIQVCCALWLGWSSSDSCEEVLRFLLLSSGSMKLLGFRGLGLLLLPSDGGLIVY